MKFICKKCGRETRYKDLPWPRINFVATDFSGDAPCPLYVICKCGEKAHEHVKGQEDAVVKG